MGYISGKCTLLTITAFLLLLNFLFLKPVFADDYYFSDEFNEENVDLDKWLVYENKGCPVQPSVQILKSGFLKLNQCKNKPKFPYVVSKVNPFPETNYTIEIAFQYTKVSYWGTGIALTDQAPPNGGGGIPSLLTIDVWQDKSVGPNMRIEFNTQMIHTVPINTDPHVLKVERVDKKYFVYLDNILVFTSPETNEQAKYIWMGNPGSFSYLIPEWTEFKVDYIRINQLADTKVPVIFIPGIGGSELKANQDILWKDQDNGHGGKFSHTYAKDEQIWVNQDQAAKLGNDDYFDVLRLKSDGQTSEADIGLTGNLTPLGYGDIDPFFTSLGYTKGINFFVFPYDWRRDISSTKDSLDFLIQTAKQKTKHDKVNIVAHSMGGLVARHYIADAERANNVNKLITLGTPHLGSPLSLKTLVYGSALKKDAFGFIPIGIPSSEVKDVFQNLPSAFQLLPTTKYFNFYTLSPFDDTRDIDKDKITGALNFNQTKNLLQNLHHNMTVFGLSENFHNILGLNQNNNVKLYNVVGSGQPTLGQVKETWWITWPIKFLPKYEQTFINGDDTVPLYSASLKNDILDLSAGANLYFVEQKHSDLVNKNGSAMQTVKTILSEKETVPVEVRSEKFYLEGKHIAVDQDADLDLYDDNGNHSGIKDNKIETNIPETFYDTLGNTKHAFVKTKSPKVKVKITPKNTGSKEISKTKTSVKIHHYKSDKITKTSVYQNIPLGKSANPSIEFNLESTKNTSPALTIVNSDNSTTPSIETVSATAELEEDMIADTTPPVTKIDFSGGILTLNSTDNQSGVLQTEYSLDNGQTIQTYTEPVIINNPGTYTLQVSAADKLGNQEIPQTVTLTVASPTPSPTQTPANNSSNMPTNTWDGGTELSRSDSSQVDLKQPITQTVTRVLTNIFQKPIQNANAAETKQGEVLALTTNNDNNETISTKNQYLPVWEFLKYPAAATVVFSAALAITFFKPAPTLKKIL